MKRPGCIAAALLLFSLTVAAAADSRLSIATESALLRRLSGLPACGTSEDGDWIITAKCNASGSAVAVSYRDETTGDLYQEERYQGYQGIPTLRLRREYQPVGGEAFLVRTETFDTRVPGGALRSLRYREPRVLTDTLVDDAGRTLKRLVFDDSSGTRLFRLIFDYDVHTGLATRLKLFDEGATRPYRIMEFDAAGRMTRFVADRALPLAEDRLPSSLVPSVQDSPNGTEHFFDRIELLDAEIRRRQDGNLPSDLIFLGDSITEFWPYTGAASWKAHFVDEGWSPLDLGIAHERTEQVLWRLDESNTNLHLLRPKVVVLNIGSNNADVSPPAPTFWGVCAVVTMIRARWPDAEVVVMAMFPRGEFYDLIRANIRYVNTTLLDLEIDPAVTVIDIHDDFISGNAVRADLLPDLVHPNAAGYEVWAQALTPVLNSLR